MSEERGDDRSRDTGPSLARRRRRLLTIAACACAALFAGIALVLVLERSGDVEPGAPRDVARAPGVIVIERPGFEDIELRRGVGVGTDAEADAGAATGWRIVAPCDIPAVEQRVEPLIDATGAVSASYPASEVDLAGAGLDAPLATLRFDGDALAIGAKDLGGERRYLLDGERVDLVPEWILALVDGGMTAFAEPSPFGAGVGVTRVHRDGRALAPPAESPAESPADPAPSSSANPAAWSDLVATQVIAWPPAEATGNPRTGRFELELDDGSRIDVELLHDERYTALRVANGGCAYIFPTDTLSDTPLDTPPDILPAPRPDSPPFAD